MNVHIVHAATDRPHMCAQCAGTKGPFLDTSVDPLHNGGRLYLCMLCLRIDAAEAGFAPGERMDTLADAKTTVEHAEQEIEERNAELRDTRNALKERDRAVTQLQAMVERLEGEIARKDHQAKVAADNVRAIYDVTEPAVQGLGVAG